MICYPKADWRLVVAPLSAFVNDVVMQKGRGVDELNCSGEVDMTDPYIRTELLLPK